MSLVQSVKRARKTSGLTLTEAAERAGLQVSNLSAIESGKREPRAETLDRVMRAARKKFIAVPGGPKSASELAEDIWFEIQRGFTHDLFRLVIQLSDNLVAARGVTEHYALVLEAPDSTGDWQLDAAIAGVVEYRLAQRQLPAPEWVLDSIVSQPTDPDELPWVGMPDAWLSLRRHYRTNEHFTSRGVYVTLEDLESV